jgi:hypothetical protein
LVYLTNWIHEKLTYSFHANFTQTFHVTLTSSIHGLHSCNFDTSITFMDGRWRRHAPTGYICHYTSIAFCYMLTTSVKGNMPLQQQNTAGYICN